MKTLKLTTRSSYSPRTFLMYVATPVMIALCMSAASTLKAHAFVQITSQLDPGARSANVTNLQEFLASMPNIYPEGLVTGYYGSLTTKAVMRFQAENGLAQVGRVGPLTLAKINAMIAGGVSTGDTTAPMVRLTNAPVVSGTTALINWYTNEAATGRVYYSTSPLQMNEGDINSTGFAVISGQVGSFDSVARLNQSTTLIGLTPNTTYYYTVVAVDAAGNVSVIGPNNTFRTTQ